jgi:SAM-dependent methyltransferase
MRSTVTSSGALSGPDLHVLRTAAAPLLPLTPLAPADYKRNHALFEARSDQRGLVIDWLIRVVAERADGPTRVLSIGCGDGAVDVRLAEALASGGHQVDYVGVEPHGPSAEEFRNRLCLVPGVTATAAVLPFGEFSPRTLASRPGGRSAPQRFDVITAVHSLYYVPDLRSALREGYRLLAPGGMLIVLHAPQETLNELVGVLAPGRTQEFSQAVAAALAAEGLPVERGRIDACVDLSPGTTSLEPGDADARRALHFAVQAVVPDELHALVVEALRAGAVPGRPLRLPHPLDTFVIRAPVDVDGHGAAHAGE